MKHVTVTQLSERWKVSPRYIQNLCRSGRLQGAVRLGKQWILPEDVQRPSDQRFKSNTKFKNSVALPNEDCWSVMCDAYQVPGTQDEVLSALSGIPEAAELTKAQFAYLHGDIEVCLTLSDNLFESSKDFEIKIGSAFLVGLCAMYKGDVQGWKRAKMLIETLPCPNESFLPRKELWLAVLGASIYDISSYPEWFRRGCFDSLPEGYFPAAQVHYIKYIYIRGDSIVKKQPLDGRGFSGHLFLLPAICEPLISQTVLSKAVVSEICLRLLCASSYHHDGEDALAIKHIDRAIALALPDRIYAPLAEQKLNLDSLIDERLRIISPEALVKVRALNNKLMNGWSVIHNTVLNRSHTNELTAKELETARLAVFGLTNIEIAKRMGISINSVKSYLQSAMEKTRVKKRTELAKFI